MEIIKEEKIKKPDTIQQNQMVSILVPVYNKEKFLDIFIQLLERQTYQNLDIVFINDGSSDASREIIEKYAEKDDRIRLINQKNQGVAVARNNAVKAAKAEMITFVDPDDLITRDYVENLVFAYEFYNADMACVDYREGNGSNWNEIDTATSELSVSLLDTEYALREMCHYRKGCGFSLWGKLMKKEHVLMHPCPMRKISEDVAASFRIVDECKRIACVNKKCYYYFINPNSLTHIYDSEIGQYQRQTTEEIEGYLKEKYPGLSADVDHFCTILLSILINNNFRGKFSLENIRKFKVYQKEMKKYSLSVFRDKTVSKAYKIKLQSIIDGYIPFYIMHKAADLRKNMR